ncbi:MAG: hypothetical protein JW920_10310 [Deltaproteobacteria bacterium]|nr:hypothetical protein [Deltaproteobacteria bacterium]
MISLRLGKVCFCSLGFYFGIVTSATALEVRIPWYPCRDNPTIMVDQALLSGLTREYFFQSGTAQSALKFFRDIFFCTYGKEL